MAKRAEREREGCISNTFLEYHLLYTGKKDNLANEYLRGKSFLTQFSCAGKPYFSRYYSNRLRKHCYTSFLSNDYYVLSWYYKNLSFYLSTAWSLMKCGNCILIFFFFCKCWKDNVFFFSIKYTLISKIQFYLKNCQNETPYFRNS